MCGSNHTVILSNAGAQPGNNFYVLLSPPSDLAGKLCNVTLKQMYLQLTDNTTPRSVEVRINLDQTESYDSRTQNTCQTLGMYQNHLNPSKCPTITAMLSGGPSMVQVQVYDMKTGSLILNDSNVAPTCTLLLQIDPVFPNKSD